jgi:DNA polymerase-3 subunit delta'
VSLEQMSEEPMSAADDSWNEAVPGQPAAVAALVAAAERPVHAYLLVGPPGTGKREAARRFAARLVADTEDGRRRALGDMHPDVITVERDGPAITMDMAREITRLAARSPLEGERKVLVLPDFHLVREAGPALLKTIEEPPPSTIFLILAEYVPPELVTIASRCVTVEFVPLTPTLVVELLVADGVTPALAEELAQAAGGRLDRARLLATDPAFELRRRAWQAVPSELDGTGATAARLTDQLVALLDDSVAPLRTAHEAELAALEARNTRAMEVNGKVGRAGRSGLKVGVKETEDRQKRAVRRQRTDELRAGLATLAAVYRDRLASTGPERNRAIEAIGLIDSVAADLVYNPGEGLAVLALLTRLGRLEVARR